MYTTINFNKNKIYTYLESSSPFFQRCSLSGRWNSRTTRVHLHDASSFDQCLRSVFHLLVTWFVILQTRLQILMTLTKLTATKTMTPTGTTKYRQGLMSYYCESQRSHSESSRRDCRLWPDSRMQRLCCCNWYFCTQYPLKEHAAPSDRIVENNVDHILMECST